MRFFGSKQVDDIDAKKVWEQTKVTARLVVSYFNWSWIHS